jgi:hypothetical protein
MKRTFLRGGAFRKARALPWTRWGRDAMACYARRPQTPTNKLGDREGGNEHFTTHSQPSSLSPYLMNRF